MYEFVHPCMGTVFAFKFGGEQDKTTIEPDFQKAAKILDDADSRFSLYKSESEISQLNQGQISWNQASKVQVEVRNQVLAWKDKTKEFFNPYSPEGVYDPSGLVKTWATENAAIFLEANGYRDFTINAGGDIYVGPEVKTFPLNRIGLSNLKPIASKEAAVNIVLDLEGTPFRGVATSGSSERGEHIWYNQDTEKRYIQVSVVAEDLVTADIWATAIISGGKEALSLFESVFPDGSARAIAISQDGSISATQGFVSLLANL